MSKQRRVTLTKLIGKSAANEKSEFAGINSFPYVGLQCKLSAAPTAGEIALKQTNANSTYNGETVATISFPTADNTTFAATAIAGYNVGTVCYAEITTALTGGTISDITLVMSLS